MANSVTFKCQSVQNDRFSLDPSPIFFSPRLRVSAVKSVVNKDRLTKARRSWNMSRIRGKDTTPERVVRSLLHRMGYRFRLHVRIPIPQELAESLKSEKVKRPPRAVSVDIVLPKYKVAIFVHGCFWHRHRGCKNCTTPTNRREWWLEKLNGNAARDKLHQHALRKMGWKPIIVWECHTKKIRMPRQLAVKLNELACKPA
jgi:DNA mismatch endonuclease (patch repair protein)